MGTPLEQAQLNYDHAVEQATSLAHQAAAAQNSVTVARNALDAAKREAAASVPVDKSAIQLTDGSPVPEDWSHTEHTASGQQKGYIVLTETERSKGFVRPVRDSYRHEKCGHVTTMGRALAETYARDPKFYSGTFCSTCRKHFPVGPEGEFIWLESNGAEREKVGT